MKPKPRRGGTSAAGNGYLAGVRSTGTYGMDDLLRDVAKSTGQSEGLVRFVDTARRESRIEDFVADMRADGFNMTVPMFQYYLNAMFEVAIDHVRKGEKVQTPFGLMELAISGSMDSADAPLDPKRNEVYVKITPPASWRKALAEVEGVIVNPAVSDLAIGNVLTVSLGRDGFNVIKPGEDFSMSGRGFPTDGTEVGAVTLRDGAGTVHVVEVMSARRECLNCSAPRTAAAGSGLVEVTLVGGKKGDCRFASSRKVKIM